MDATSRTGTAWLKQKGQEEFEYTKGAIRIRISKKNRQQNGQKQKYKRTPLWYVQTLLIRYSYI
jgi:hypothetical protein